MIRLSLKVPFDERAMNIFFVLMPLSFFLPLRFFNVVLTSFFAIVALQLVLGRIEFFRWRSFLMLIVPMLILLYGFFIDVSNGLTTKSIRELESYLPILFFPLLLNFIDVTNERVQWSKQSFFTGSVLAALACLGFAVWKNMADHDRIVHNWNFIETMKFYNDNPVGLINWGFFLYVEFSDSIDFHPVYLGTYFIVAILFGISFLRQPLSHVLKIVIGLSIILLMIEIFLLSGRMPILILFLLTSGGIGYLLLQKMKRRYWWIMFAFVGMLAVIPFLMPVGLYRLQTSYHLLRNPPEEVGNSSSNLHRIIIWRRSLELVTQNFWKGYGLYGGEKALDLKLMSDEGSRFNTHNQYFMVQLATGIFGLLLFALFHSKAILFALKNQNYIYAAFLSVLLLAMLTENLISRHKGVLLYAYFNTLFFINIRNEKKV